MSWQRDFFVGWAGRLPTEHAPWLRSAVAVALGGFLLAGLLLSRAQDDPGGGTGASAEVTLDGVLTALPYPTLTLAAATSAAPARTILLSGAGKMAPDFDAALDGRTVRATGYRLRRGALEMLQVTETLRRAETDLPAPPARDLGTWRITGEDEADPTAGKLSCVSPFALALKDAKVGDVVIWKRPVGDLELEVTRITYPKG